MVNGKNGIKNNHIVKICGLFLKKLKKYLPFINYNLYFCNLKLKQ